MRLLVIEDEAELAKAVARGLESLGYAVDIALDAIDGEQLAMAVNYDLIILDLNLPGKDGIDVCRYMRENGCTAAVLLLTARNKVSDRDCARISIVLLLMGVAVVLFLSLTLQQSMKNQPLTKVTTTDNIIVIGIDNGKRIVAMYDSTSGKSIWSSDITAVAGKNTSSFSSDSQKVRYNNSGKNICVMAPSGVYSYDGSGNFIGNVLDFSKYMILASGNTVSDLNVDQRGNIYITTREFGSHEIYRYDIDAGAHEARECKAITLAVPVTDRRIEVAAIKFQKEYPDYWIDIRPYEQNNNAAGGFENYVKTLNTELLTGKGPDIIAASWIPYEKYIDKNMFVDLSELMEQDKGFDKSKYYTNIFDALKYKDRLYALPVCIRFDLLNLVKEFGDGKIPNDTSERNANFNDIDSIEKGIAVFSPQTISDYTFYAFLIDLYNDQIRLLNYPSSGQVKGGVFDSDALFSINSNSKNKDIAWEFLKFLLSDEVQSGELESFPVNKESLAKTVRKAIELTGSGSMAIAIGSQGEKPKIITPRALTQQDIDYINGFIENMRVFNRSNASVNRVIQEETLVFFAGQRTAEETGRLIQEKVSIYLGE